MRGLVELGKMFFILFYFKSSLRSQENKILHIQIWWCHHMTKHKTRNTFYWTTWEVISLLMKFGPFIWYFKRKLFKSFYKSWDLKNSSRPFWVCKAQPLLENEISETTYLIRNSKTIKICPKQPTDLLRFLFTEDSLKIKKVRN